MCTLAGRDCLSVLCVAWLWLGLSSPSLPPPSSTLQSPAGSPPCLQPNPPRPLLWPLTCALDWIGFFLASVSHFLKSVCRIKNCSMLRALSLLWNCLPGLVGALPPPLSLSSGGHFCSFALLPSCVPSSLIASVGPALAIYWPTCGH